MTTPTTTTPTTTTPTTTTPTRRRRTSRPVPLTKAEITARHEAAVAITAYQDKGSPIYGKTHLDIMGMIDEELAKMEPTARGSALDSIKHCRFLIDQARRRKLTKVFTYR